MDKNRLAELKKMSETWQLQEINLELLNRALIHPSYAFENQGRTIEHNQRLEFLGDAVLGLIAAEYLYQSFPDLSEGDLTKIRASAVCESTLAAVARLIGLGDYLCLGKGEELSGGRERPSILADALEAVIGAIYLSGGFEPVRSFILRYLKDSLSQPPGGHLGDYKTTLQETVQQRGSESVSYKIMQEFGPDHNKRFIAGVFYRGRLLGQGEGRTKKEAEQQAARIALEKTQWDLIFQRAGEAID